MKKLFTIAVLLFSASANAWVGENFNLSVSGGTTITSSSSKFLDPAAWVVGASSGNGICSYAYFLRGTHAGRNDISTYEFWNVDKEEASQCVVGIRTNGTPESPLYEIRVNGNVVYKD